MPVLHTSLSLVAQDPSKAPLSLEGDDHAQVLCPQLLRASADRQEVDMAFQIAEHFIQGAGVVQGGILASMLELAIGAVAQHASQSELAPVMVNLNVAFLRPAAAGAYRALAKIERAGRTVVFAQASLFDAKNQCVATGRGALSLPRPA